MIHPGKDQQGIALVVTLLAVVLITALVVEFSYGVYIGTSNLYNWRDSQRLSLMTRSGVNVAAKLITASLRDKDYSYPGIIEFPIEKPFEGFTGMIMIRIEDESSKFNINAVVPSNENIRESDQQSPYNCFKRLLRVLALDERIADRIVDWIDTNREARLADSERAAPNSVLLSSDEILLIPGISRDDYNILLPYITVYGTRDNLSININGAEKPVLRCLSEKITDELAQRVIDFRKNNPFQETSDLSKVAGFERDTGIPPGVVAVKGEHFFIQSEADSEGVKRVIQSVLNIKNTEFEYWKEY
jgi:general secretion pathway protein K